MNKNLIVKMLYTQNGSQVIPLYRIGNEVIEAKRVKDGFVKRYSIYELKTEEEMMHLRKVQSSLPDIKKKDRVKRKVLIKKYDRKFVKKIAIKLAGLVRKQIDELKTLEPKDLWALIPTIKDFNEYKKGHLRQIYRAMIILERFKLHHPDLMNDVKNELELRKKSNSQREEERKKIREFKDKWKEQAREVIKNIRSSKTPAINHVREFANKIYDEDYKKYSLDDCKRIAISLVEEIEEENNG